MVSVQNVGSVVTNGNGVNGVNEGKNETRLRLSDTASNMTTPTIPTPHKNQIHVLIIGTCSC